MQYKFESCKFIISIILVCVIMRVINLSPSYQKNTTIVKNVVSTNTVYYPYYKTVAHLDVPSAWTLVSTNELTDTAYYITNTTDLGFTEPKLNDKVILVNTAMGNIIDITITGFSVKIDPSKIYPGLSGTPVYNETGAVLGYVSAYVGSGTIYCIWR